MRLLLKASLVAVLLAFIGVMNVEATFIPSLVRTIQRATVTINTPSTTGTATITSVNTGSAVVFPGGVEGANTTFNGIAGDQATNVLTNATTVTVDCGIDSFATPNCLSNFSVVEFVSSVKVQRGIITIGSGSLSAGAFITAVNMNKSWLVSCGQTANGQKANTGAVSGVLTNSTTVTATRNASDPTSVNYCYQVVSFK